MTNDKIDKLDARRLELRKKLIICEDDDTPNIIDELLDVTDKICDEIRRQDGIND